MQGQRPSSLCFKLASIPCHTQNYFNVLYIQEHDPVGVVQRTFGEWISRWLGKCHANTWVILGIVVCMNAIYYTRVVNCFLVSVWGQYWTRVACTSDGLCKIFDSKNQAWWWHRSTVRSLEDTQLNLESVRRGPCTEHRIYYTRVVN